MSGCVDATGRLRATSLQPDLG